MFSSSGKESCAIRWDSELVSRKGRVRVLVVDSAEKLPAEN